MRPIDKYGIVYFPRTGGGSQKTGPKSFGMSEKDATLSAFSSSGPYHTGPPNHTDRIDQFFLNVADSVKIYDRGIRSYIEAGNAAAVRCQTTDCIRACYQNPENGLPTVFSCM